MPSLPRFHPARFPSQQSNVAATPVCGSPISRHSDAHLQMYFNQRERLASPAPSDRGPTAKPTSPRLVPVNSPGPVTPLQLENAKSYLAAGANSTNAAYYGDELVRKEAVRHDFHLADTDIERRGIGRLDAHYERTSQWERAPRLSDVKERSHGERSLKVKQRNMA